jgi:hypothetical protein
MKKLTLLLMLSMVLLAGLTMAIAQTKPTTLVYDDPNDPPELCLQSAFVCLDDPNDPPELCICPLVSFDDPNDPPELAPCFLDDPNDPPELF